MRKTLLLGFAMLALQNISSAQFGYGLTVNYMLYERFNNPDEDPYYDAAGNALLNLGMGPKIWVGNMNFSVSAEASANIGFLGLAVKDYKGLGMASFPMLINLNFKGLSGFDPEWRPGFSIGGGVQYSRTELYGVTNKFDKRGVDRKLFPTYILHAAYGTGFQGFGIGGFVRYGFHPDNNANTLSVGIQWDFNAVQLRKIRNKASEL